MNSLLKFFWNLMFRLTGRDVSFDAGYEDMSFYSLELRAKLQAVKGLLEKRHLAPKETAPGETRLQIVGCGRSGKPTWTAETSHRRFPAD